MRLSRSLTVAAPPPAVEWPCQKQEESRDRKGAVEKIINQPVITTIRPPLSFSVLP